uniref:Electron transfer flavoprotein subunit alpha n=1 Tax=Schistocephalus solidus TaxID=70667 RepID=A0A0X3Q3M9_SCHSO
MNLTKVLALSHHFRNGGLRFLSTLVVAEHENSKISSATLSAITAASLIGDVTCVVAGPKCGPIAEYVSSIQGVKKVMFAENSVFEHPIAELYSQLVLACQSSVTATHIIAGTSAFSRSFMPRVAVTLNSSLISDVLAVLSPDTFQRAIYAGNALMTFRSLDKVNCLTVRETSFTPAEPSSNKALIQPVDCDIGEYNNVKFVEQIIAKKDRPGLNEAKIVISGGRALKSKENFQLLYTLADKLGAAVGATRAAVDAGFVHNELQIGQTGKVVAPELYIAVGISGAIQHLAGMKESKVIVAINKDPDAPIFQVADYGLVEDLFKAIPELTKSV